MGVSPKGKRQSREFKVRFLIVTTSRQRPEIWSPEVAGSCWNADGSAGGCKEIVKRSELVRSELNGAGIHIDLVILELD